MADKKGGKLCPICDSPLDPGSKKCGFCGTDLAIFDSEAEQKETGEALESKLEEVFFGPAGDAAPAAEKAEPSPEPSPEPQEAAAEAEPEPTAEPKPEPSPAAAPTPEPVAEPEPVTPAAVEEPSKPAQEPAQEPAAEAAPTERFFECPQCGAHVADNARSCPSCGVMFADEGQDMFQCPACNSLVNIDATSCPGCGALFVDSDEATSVEPAAEPAVRPTPEPKPEMERPVEEVIVEPDAMAAEELEEEAGGAKKGLLGGIFGRKKKRKKDAEEEPGAEEAEESILRRREEPRFAAESPAAARPPARIEPEVRMEQPARAPVTAAEPAAVRPPAAEPPEPKHKPKELARLTAEMQPLMRLASDNGVDVSECRRLVDEGAMSARARQIDSAYESVMKARELLMKNLTESAQQLMADLQHEVSVAKTLGGDVSRTGAYLDQMRKAELAVDFEAVYIYAGKVKNELMPITGRYNESKQKLGTLTNLVTDSEMIDVDTKEARLLLVEATRSFEANDFDKADETVRSATKSLYSAIEPRMEDEIRRARNQLVEVKAKGMNITPMITVLKSARTLMKSKDYQQALKEMREFKQQLEKAL